MIEAVAIVMGLFYAVIFVALAVEALYGRRLEGARSKPGAGIALDDSRKAAGESGIRRMHVSGRSAPAHGSPALPDCGEALTLARVNLTGV